MADKETSLIPYRTERNRGYEWQGSLWSPGYFRADLGEGDRTTLVASTEEWDTIRGLSPEGVFRAELDRRKRLLDAAPPQARTTATCAPATPHIIRGLCGHGSSGLMWMHGES